MGFSTLTTIEAKFGDPKRPYTYWIKRYRGNAVRPFGVMSECSGGRAISPYFPNGANGGSQTLIFGFGGIEITLAKIAQKSKKIPNTLKILKSRCR